METEAAAVILQTQTGGSGTFKDLAVVVDRQGSLVPIASTFLGGRVVIQNISIENYAIILDLLTHRPGEQLCCPTNESRRTYKLCGNAIVQISGEN